MFTCTQKLLSPESMAVQEKYCFREARLTSNCELGYTLKKTPISALAACLLLKAPGTFLGFLNRPSVRGGLLHVK